MNSKLVLASRILLGLIFFIFGLNGLLMFTVGTGFIPAPPPPPEMMTIMSGFVATKYLMPLVKGLQVLSGLFLLSGFFVNLALVFLAPIIVNILAIHLFVDWSGLPIAVIICALYLVLFRSRFEDFKALFKK